jgi:hypothetical protein
LAGAPEGGARAAAPRLSLAIDTAQKTNQSYIQFLAELLGIEVKVTERRALQRCLRLAGAALQKTLEGAERWLSGG